MCAWEGTDAIKKQVATSLLWKVRGIVISVLRGIFWVEKMVSSASELKLVKCCLD